MPDPVQSQHAALAQTVNPSYPTGTFAPVTMDPTTGALKVYIAGGGGSGGTSSTDEALFTAGSSAGTPVMGVVNPADTPSNGQLAVVAVDSARNLKVNVVAGGGGAATIADGADVTEGAKADTAVVGDNTGSISAKLRGLNKILNSVWSSANSWLQVSIQNASLTVAQGTASNLQAQVGGLGAAGASVAGNPLRLGGLGRTTTPTAVSSAQLVDLLLDRLGRMFVVAPVTSRASSAGTAITTNANTAIVAAPSSGNHLRIHRLWAQNSSATGTWCYWGNGSGDKTGPAFYLAQYQPFSMAMEGRWELSSVTGLYLNTATTGANIEWYVEYETLAD